MKITKHGEYLVQLSKLARTFPVNVQLVREDDGLTLVDAGTRGMASGILSQARSMGLPITRIVLTHTDADHIGALDELRAQFPDAEVLMSALSAQLLSGEIALDKNGNEVRSDTPRKAAETGPTGVINDGDRVGSLDVIAAPGHKPDQIAFLDVRDRTLIVGDAFQTRGGLAVAGVIRVIFPFPALFTLDKATALETARKLRALEPSRLATGHGAVLESPLAEMDKAIAEASRKFGNQKSHAS